MVEMVQIPYLAPSHQQAVVAALEILIAHLLMAVPAAVVLMVA
jgi:hypothetical protein